MLKTNQRKLIQNDHKYCSTILQTYMQCINNIQIKEHPIVIHLNYVLYNVCIKYKYNCYFNYNTSSTSNFECEDYLKKNNYGDKKTVTDRQ